MANKEGQRNTLFERSFAPRDILAGDLALPKPCFLASRALPCTYHYPLKLLQESDIVIAEMADVVDPIAHQGAAVNAHPRGKTGIFRGIISAIFQHHRVHHAAAEDLQPAGFLANAAALATSRRLAR